MDGIVDRERLNTVLICVSCLIIWGGGSWSYWRQSSLSLLFNLLSCVVAIGVVNINASSNDGGGRDLHWGWTTVVVGDDMVVLSLVSIEVPLIIIVIVLLKVYGGISAHGSQRCQGFWSRGLGARSWQPPPLPLSTLTPNPQGLPQPLEFPSCCLLCGPHHCYYHFGHHCHHYLSHPQHLLCNWPVCHNPVTPQVPMFH